MDRYYVIGNPIGHSKSPLIHGMFAGETSQHMVYEPLLAEIGGFASAVKRLIAQGAKGCNVTVPFKLDAYKLSTRLTQRASDAGAVNTLKFEPDGSIVGDNTDGAGLAADLEALGVRIKGHDVLILGAGGAARGIIGPILDKRPARLVIANRTVQKAEALADMFGCGCVGTGYDGIEGTFAAVINATSSSISGEVPPIPESAIGKSTFAYDLMYADDGTAFTHYAEECGASGVADGLGMLVRQAAESFYLWRGVMPKAEPVIAALKKGRN